MELYKVKDRKVVKPLVKDWEETLLWSYLQGCMGEAWADALSNPQSAQIIVGDFCFLVGKPNLDMVMHKPRGLEKKFIIMAPETEEWHPLIERVYGQKATKRERYAIKKEENVFNKEKLESFVQSLAPEYTICMIGEMLYHQILEQRWCCDFCSNYATYQEYKEHGLGVVILKDGEIIAGASSYSYYRNGIEIEIDTREEYRQRGLATVCGAKLILECLKRGLYPSWDAQNLISVSLAEKLGYHFDKTYPVYEIFPYELVN